MLSSVGLAAAVATMLPFRTVWRDEGNALPFPDRTHLVVRTPAVWSGVFAQIVGPRYVGMGPRPELPRVDFDHEMIVLVATDRKPYLGFRIEIQSVVERDEALVVNVVETDVDGCGDHYDVMVQPIHAVTLRKDDRPVRFEVRVENPCRPLPAPTHGGSSTGGLVAVDPLLNRLADLQPGAASAR